MGSHFEKHMELEHSEIHAEMAHNEDFAEQIGVILFSINIY